MPALATFSADRLSHLEARRLTRRLRVGQRTGPVTIERDGRPLVSFSCNSYLGLSHHPEVIAAATAATIENGTGAGASRLVTGSQEGHAALERALAEWKGYDAALLFGSGYLANLGVIPALMAEGDLILLDKLSHACLIDAAQLSGARVMRWKHNDKDDLRRRLALHRARHRQCLIVTETVFSMDGDRAPLSAAAALAKAYDSWWLADDAHGLGETVTPRPDILTGTLSKALGSYGGYALADAASIDYLRSGARSFMFSTALPPGDIAAATAALEVARREPERAEQARSHARSFAAQLGLPPPQSQIVPLIFGAADAALKASAMLEKLGFLVTAIRPPTVPPGTSRLRFTFSSAHTAEMVDALVAAVRRLPLPASALAS